MMNGFEEIPNITPCTCCDHGIAHLRKCSTTLRDTKGAGEVIGEVDMFYFECDSCGCEFADADCVDYNAELARGIL